ncbi:EAL domain-containing protein [Oceanithermus sp.]|uniref:bifunctional diguanylate cyclase/phosphodiesterase n=1 Tax=Oceanithermus sp. TaxID=2268145 RepID=UPI0025E603B6|nr:EAL domain-containing protein [Oceanithermus sp.]
MRAARALRCLDRRLGEGEEPHVFMDRVLGMATGVLGALGGVVLMRTGSEERLRTVAACGRRPPGGERRWHALLREALEQGGKVVTWQPCGEAARVEGGNDPRCVLAVAVPGPKGPLGVLALALGRGCPRARWSEAFLEGLGRRLGYVLERRQASELLERGRRYDQVTGLPNRGFLLRHLTRRMAPRGVRGWVAFVEVEDFTEINDVWGYTVGDAVLREAARRLREERKRGIWVARCGSGRFVLVGAENPDLEWLGRVAARLEYPVEVGDTTVHPRVRVGVARFSASGVEPQELLRRAGRALVEARSRGERVVLYRPGVGRPHSERARVERLRASLERPNGIELVYQPIVDLMDGRVVYVEALARWRDPISGRPVPPNRFVALAERYGMVTALDRAVVAQATRLAHRAWEELGARAPRVTINVAPESLTDPEFVDFAVASARGLPLYKRPVLELTERSLLDPVAVRPTLARLHEAGFQVFVDDLGSGYASFAALALVEVDAFKVDRTLVLAVDEEERARALLRGIVRLGRELGLPVIVEGVEHGSQLSWLRSEDVRLAQGFYLGRPKNGSRLIASLRSRASGRAAGVATDVLPLDTVTTWYG